MDAECVACRTRPRWASESPCVQGKQRCPVPSLQRVERGSGAGEPLISWDDPHGTVSSPGAPRTPGRAGNTAGRVLTTRPTRKAAEGQGAARVPPPSPPPRQSSRPRVLGQPRRRKEATGGKRLFRARRLSK